MPEDVAWWSKAIEAQKDIGSQGLEVEVLAAGDGLRYPKAGDVVSVKYVGYLPSGEVFDSTYRRGRPLSFTLGRSQVIEGLDAAIAQLSLGERAKIRIGADRAYGKRGFPFLVPPSTGLIFDLEYIGGSDDPDSAATAAAD